MNKYIINEFESFESKNKYSGDVVIPEGTKFIGNNVFSDCRNLTTVKIPNTVSSIGHDAFRGCSNLQSITIPNSVSSIGYNAFGGCSKLTSITIPKHLGYSKLNLPRGCEVIIQKDEDEKKQPKTQQPNQTKQQKLQNIIKQYIKIYKHEFMNPTKPDFQSVDSDFIDSTIDKLTEINELMENLDLKLKNFDEFIVQHNTETNEISSMLKEFNSL